MTGELNNKRENNPGNLTVEGGKGQRYNKEKEEFLDCISIMILNYANYMKNNDKEIEGGENNA